MSITKKKLTMEDLVVVAYLFAVVVADEGATLMKIMRVCLFCMTAILIVKRKKVIVNSYVVWLLSFWAISCCSIGWAKNRDFALAMTKTLLFNALCLYSLMYLVKIKPNRKEYIYKCLAIFPLILEMRAILAGGVFVFVNQRSIGDISANTVGYCSALGACFAYYLFLQSKHKRDLILLLVNLCIMLLSGSRKAMVFFIIPAMFLYLYQEKKNATTTLIKLFSLALFGIAGFLLLLNVPLLYNAIGHRVASMVTQFIGGSVAVDESTEDRILLTTWGIEWFKQKQLLGWGIDNYRVVLTTFYPMYPITYYAHNNYVELLVDVGAVGTMIYYYIHAVCIIAALNKRKHLTREQFFFSGILCTIILCDVGVVSYFDKYLQVILLGCWQVLTDNHYINAKHLTKI